MSAKDEVDKVLNRHRRLGHRGSPSTLEADTIEGVTYRAMAQDQLHAERYGKVRDKQAWQRTPVGWVEKILDELAGLPPGEIRETLRPYSDYSWKDALCSWLEDVHQVCVLGMTGDCISFQYAVDKWGSPSPRGMSRDVGGARIPHQVQNACMDDTTYDDCD